MTTTLPASIPGLLRTGSPVVADSPVYGPISGVILDVDGKLYACMATRFEVFPPELVKDSDPYELDLTDPTGFFHALLFLAAKLGMSTTNGVWWRYAFGWRLETPLASWTFGVGIGSDRYTRAAIPADADPAEALRLAVLAVAGVQG